MRRLERSGRLADGVASFYDDRSGGTACGYRAALGVANKTLPCGTVLWACASSCALLTVDDRGPYVAGREYDLSLDSVSAIGFPSVRGYAPISVRVVRIG